MSSIKTFRKNNWTINATLDKNNVPCFDCNMVLSAIGYSNPSLVRYKYIGTVTDNCHVAKDIKNENDGCFVYLSGLREVISRSSKINANCIYSWIESEIIPELLKNKSRDLVNEDTYLNNSNTYERHNYAINTKNGVTIFNNAEFGQVRTILIENEPWFVGKDVAEALQYNEPHKAITRHIEEDDRMKHPITDGTSRIQNQWIINESGLYSLIISSKLQSAKRFKRWVTSEILPALRKTGTYSMQQKQDSYMIEDPAARARRWAEEYEEKQRIEQENTKLLEVNDQLQTENDEMRPKAKFHDDIHESENCLLLGEFAAILQNNHNIKIGQNKLFKFCREHNILCASKNNWNKPYQKMIDKGYFQIRETVYERNGKIYTSQAPVITGKGQIWLTNLLLKEFEK